MSLAFYMTQDSYFFHQQQSVRISIFMTGRIQTISSFYDATGFNTKISQLDQSLRLCITLKAHLLLKLGVNFDFSLKFIKEAAWKMVFALKMID